jgi:hypothetical protein
MDRVTDAQGQNQTGVLEEELRIEQRENRSLRKVLRRTRAFAFILVGTLMAHHYIENQLRDSMRGLEYSLRIETSKRNQVESMFWRSAAGFDTCAMVLSEAELELAQSAASCQAKTDGQRVIVVQAGRNDIAEDSDDGMHPSRAAVTQILGDSLSAPMVIGNGSWSTITDAGVP